MKCDICRSKDATVHLTEIINNKMTKLHLCEGCAKEKSREMEEHFGLADLLSGLADLAPVVGEEEQIPGRKIVNAGIKCSSCGFSFQNFRKMGRLGCPKCYATFKEQLSPLLRKIHGSDIHVGKTPFEKEIVRDEVMHLADVRRALEKAIRLEEFEEAARLRDQIRALEGRKDKKK